MHINMVILQDICAYNELTRTVLRRAVTCCRDSLILHLREVFTSYDCASAPWRFVALDGLHVCFMSSFAHVCDGSNILRPLGAAVDRRSMPLSDVHREGVAGKRRGISPVTQKRFPSVYGWKFY